MPVMVNVPLDPYDLQRRIHDYACSVVTEANWSDLTTVLDFAAPNPIDDDLAVAIRTALPVLAHIAVGGDGEAAIPLAASWHLYYWASTLLDDIVDQDHPSRPWSCWNTDRALHAGIGLLLAAQTCLTRLTVRPEIALDIHRSLSEMLLHMARGQAHPPDHPTLAAYFEYVVQKAGLFFAGFARAGACLHTADPAEMKAMFDYGLALGVLVQVRNDRTWDSLISDARASLFTLPVIYGMSVEQHPQHARLIELWDSRREWTLDQRHEVRDTLMDMSFPNYCAKLEQIYAEKARSALNCFPVERTKYLLALTGVPIHSL